MKKTVSVIAAPLLLACVLTGCSPDNTNPQPTTTEAATTVESHTDAELCMGVSDVQSVVYNSRIATDQNRMATQEQLGWQRLAARVLSYLKPAGDSDVAQTVTKLQEISTPVAPGATGRTEFDTDKWNEAIIDLSGQCQAAGHPMAHDAFTGG